MKKRKWRRFLSVMVCVMMISTLNVLPVFATGNVADAIEQTWNAAQGQVKQVVNNVVFPVIDMILIACIETLKKNTNSRNEKSKKASPINAISICCINHTKRKTA